MSADASAIEAKGDRGDRDKKRPVGRRKQCKFCADETIKIDYKDASLLKYFITDRGKLVPRRISGNCAKHQRVLSLQIKRARALALIPTPSRAREELNHGPRPHRRRAEPRRDR